MILLSGLLVVLRAIECRIKQEAEWMLCWARDRMNAVLSKRQDMLSNNMNDGDADTYAA